MSTKHSSGTDLVSLMACGSPGSALALHESTLPSKAELLQSSEATGVAIAGEPTATAQPGSWAWLGRLLGPLFESSWDREIREREGFLARAQNAADLESRMRAVDDMSLLRGRAVS